MDSLGRGCGPFPDDVHLQAIPGMSLRYMNSFLHRLDFNYSVFMILLGTNDIHRTPIDDFVTAYRGFLRLIRRSSPGCVIIVSTILPRITRNRSLDQNFDNERAKLFSRAIEVVCQYEDTPVVRLTKLFLKAGVPRREFLEEDGLHLTPLGRRRLTHGLLNTVSDAGILRAQKGWRLAKDRTRSGK